VLYGKAIVMSKSLLALVKMDKRSKKNATQKSWWS